MAIGASAALLAALLALLLASFLPRQRPAAATMSAAAGPTEPAVVTGAKS